MPRHHLDQRADKLIEQFNGDLLLDTKQLAEQLGVSPQFLNGGRCRGWGPKFVRLGSRVKYHPRDVAEWLNERRHARTSEYDTSRVAGPGRSRKAATMEAAK